MSIARLNQQIITFLGQERFPEARRAAEKLCDLVEQQDGAAGENYAASLNLLATVHLQMGQIETAASLLDRAQTTFRAVSADQSRNYAHCLSNLGLVLRRKGIFRKALAYYERAVVLFAEWGEKAEAARIQTTMGDIYLELGQYTQAHDYFWQALATKEAMFGRQHPAYADGLIFKARLHRTLGQWEQAERLLQEALAICRRQPQPAHKRQAVCHNELGLLRHRLQQFDEAETQFEAALELQLAVYPAAHPELAHTRNNLALVYRATGRYQEAAAIYQKLLDEDERGEADPFQGQVHFNYALLLEESGDVETAYTQYKVALAHRRRWYGDAHPDTIETSYRLAALRVAKRPSPDLNPLQQMFQAARLEDELLAQVFAIGSETERLRYLGMVQMNTFLTLACLRRQRENGQPVSLAEAYNLVLRRKGIHTETAFAQQTAVWQGQHPHLADLFAELAQIRMALAETALRPTVPADTVAELQAEKERLESALARELPDLPLKQTLLTADHRALAQRLPPQSVLVEFIRVRDYDFSAQPAAGQSPWGHSQYLAFVLPAGAPEQLALLDLGPAAPIDEHVRRLTRAMSEGGRGLGTAVFFEDDSRPEGNLHHIPALDAVVKAVGDSRRLFLAPDGDLSLLSFAVLRHPPGRYWLDAYMISYLTTGRDLVRNAETGAQPAGPPLVLANPDFDWGQPPTGFPFKPLAYSHVEGQEVARLLGVAPRLKAEAKESVVKSQRRPRFLHLATHGFFVPYRESASNPGAGDGPTGLERLAAARNALYRAGLALAGANTTLAGGTLPQEAGDGILTAEEIRNLDLQDTELVVLSACDTGIGDALDGEGVFGFRRAFTVAGASTLIMSLWSVPDASTKTLMVRFYRYLQAGLPRVEALRQAQLDLKAEGNNEKRPSRWGAFICQGDSGRIHF